MISFTVIAFTAAMFLSARGESLRVRLVRALDAAGMSRKDAAITMRLTEQRLSEALNGRSPLSVFRLEELPDTFHRELDGLNVASRGGLVLHDARLTKLVEGVELVMARAELPPSYGRTRTVELPLGRRKEQVG